MSSTVARRPGGRATLRHRVALLPLVVALAIAAPAGSAGDPDATAAFESANAAFAAGRHAEAADAFAAIARRHGSSAALLFDLGNASFRAGRVGDAVLAWEQALVLAPRSPEIAGNLRLARRAANLPVPEPGPWERVVDLLGADGWALLAAACWALAIATFLAGRATRAVTAGRGGPTARARWAAPTLLAIALLAVTACASSLARLDRAVVVGREPALRSAPYASAQATQVLTPGEIVAIERVHDGWVLARTSDGRSGWIEPGHAARVGDLPGPGYAANDAG